MDAQTNANVYYGQYAVNGSMAYDYNNPDLYDGQQAYAPAPEAAAPVREGAYAARPAAQAAPHGKQGISPVAVLGVLLIAALIVADIFGRVQLLEYSTLSLEQEERLDELQTENARLQIAYESAFNLTEIEEYALDELGMQKPGPDQIYYVDTSTADKAVVLSDGESDGFVDRLSDFITGLRAYFKKAA